MKKVGLACFALVTLFATSSCNSGEKKQEIVVWSFTNEAEYAVEAYLAENPDVSIDFQYIPGSQFETKLRSALATGIRAPDVFALEAGYVRKFIDHPSLEVLSEAPYHADELILDHYEYVQEMEKDSEGEVRTVGYQGTTGGFYYRRDLTEQYLKTSDPEEVSAMIQNWDDIFEIGEKVNEESNGDIHIFPNWSSIGTIQNARAELPWVVDNELVIDDAKRETLTLVDRALETHSLAMLDNGSPGLTSSMQKGSVMFYPQPSWFLNHVLRSDAPDTSGLWGLASGPAAFSGGGTYYGMYSEGENKDLAWDFIKYYGFNEDFLKELAVDEEYYTSHRIANEEVADEITSEFLDGQNYFHFFNEESETVQSVLRSPFDGDIEGIYGSLMDSYARGNFASHDEFWERFKRDVQIYFPELTVN